VFVFGEADRPVNPRADRRRLWVAATVLVLAAGAFGVYRFAGRGGLTGGYACMFAVSDDKAARKAAEELCHRTATDRSRRAAITNPGPIGYDGTAAAMLGTISRAVLCPPPALPNSCARQPGRAATDADVVSARDALVTAGLPGSIVRIARAADPAPAGSLVFALLMGDGCVVGYLDPGTGRSWHEVGGLLPNGRCLAS
jgi:hypothetical protein